MIFRIVPLIQISGHNKQNACTTEYVGFIIPFSLFLWPTRMTRSPGGVLLIAAFLEAVQPPPPFPTSHHLHNARKAEAEGRYAPVSAV